MNKKKEILKELVKVVQTHKVEQWYEENMTGDNQGKTIGVLLEAVQSGKLTVEEALGVAFLVGFQWNEKFEGVP